MQMSASYSVAAVCLFAFVLLLQEEACFPFQGVTTPVSNTCRRRRRRRRRANIIHTNNNLSSWRPKVCSSSSSHDKNDFIRLFQQKDDNGSTKNDDDDDDVDDAPEYRNVATRLLSNFMQKSGTRGKGSSATNAAAATTATTQAPSAATTTTANDDDDPLQDIDFQAPKFSKKVSLDTLAAVLDAELVQKEWFVTGNVNPIYFADSFVFQDPDVRLEGIEAYARGVNTLFDQTVSRAEIISTLPAAAADKPNVITCTWRLSGKANIGPFGLTIKPYIVYTDFTIDSVTNLIVFQEDRFDLPQWDILLSSLFPFLIGTVTAPPAPPVESRVVEMPKI